MVVAIASGKGGTGKTMLATNLAHVLAKNGRQVQLLDCDVEAPNSHLFLKSHVWHEEPVEILVPNVDEKKCTLCGKCAKVCEFNAIGVFGSSVLVFNELCHACGGCSLACPVNAISEVGHQTGTLKYGSVNDNLELISGELNIGEAKAPPVIAAVKKKRQSGRLAIIDAPPGTSCPVVESVRDADFVVLVTEPTPFGLHDLKLTVDLMRKLHRQFGVVVNRSTIGDNRITEYCNKENVPVLTEIPYRRDIAEAYSTGELLTKVLPDYEKRFIRLYENVKTLAEQPFETESI